MSSDIITVERSGKIHHAAGDAARLDAYIPSECPQNHAANLLHLPNGDVLCVWFGGTQEGIADISIYLSRLVKGSEGWSKAVKLSDDATRSEQNPVLFLAPDNVLWLLYTAQKSGNQDTAIVRYRQSTDFGASWGAIARCWISRAPSFANRSPCWRTATGCCRCSTAACSRVRNGSATTTIAP